MTDPLAPFWSDRRVLLTGGGGFLGSFLREAIEKRHPEVLLSPLRTELDLLDVPKLRRFLEVARPNLVIHAAAAVGGIGANRRHPGKYFYENASMGIHLIEESRRAGVEKFVCLGTVCAYPKFAPIPFREEHLWDGFPEETNAPYGIAKKVLLTQLQAYRDEYGFKGIYLLPVNLYGPGDNFDLQSSHVIPAMIRKFLEARLKGEASVTLWGDGTATREFLYVTDAADGIVQAAALYDDPSPVNLGRGEEISIAQLASLIAEKTGFAGEILWDATKPNGQPRRMLDVRRADEYFGFRAQTSLSDGLNKTIEWYEGQLGDVR